jgi:hypothetical protein
VLRGYGSERDVAAGDVLFADGDETYDLVVLLAGTADIIEGYGHPRASVVASYGPSESASPSNASSRRARPTLLAWPAAERGSYCGYHLPRRG